MDKYMCKVCSYIYDPAEGDPDAGVDAGLPFSVIPDDWHCPQCGAPKSEFDSYDDPMPGMVIPVGREAS